MLVVIGVAVGLFLVVVNTLFPLQDVISLETARAKDEARVCAWVFISIFACGIPINGVCRIFNGLQKSWVVHIIRSIGAVVSILVVVLLTKFEAEPYYLLAGTYGVQTAMPLLLLAYIFQQGWLTTTPHRNWQQAKIEYKYLLNIGGLFLALQIGTMVGWGADTLIVSSLAGAVAVAQLAIAQRMYQLVSVPLSILNAPLWAAYADAKAHEDIGFLERTLKKSLLGTLLLSGILSISIFLASGVVLELWIGDTVQVSTSLLLAFLIWKIMEATGNSFAMFLNGFHIIRPQIVSVAIFCVLALPLKFHFVPKYGAPAVIWSTVAAYGVAVVMFYSVLYRRELVSVMWRRT